MCGIAGIVSLTDAPVDASPLERMIGRVSHRGPDDAGIYQDRQTALAHARLSIIDLAGGRQPLHNEDETLWIVFNGEIFNYVELRAELEAVGHRFATQTDTEVILHLYEDLGADCVARLNGQWAFAIWDSRRRRLFLSRDRLGVRPLFYARARRQLVFGSEIKALFAHPAVERTLDLEGLDQVFTFWCPVSPRTVFAGVSELPPGHSMTVEAGVTRVERYWSLDYDVPAPPSENDAAEQLLALLQDATRIRLRSDVPVGAYLSGGLDSTVITALIKRCDKTTLRTFSIAFDDPEFDESRYQREAIAHLGTDHTSFRCTGADIGRVFPDVVWHAEQPLVRTAPAPLFLLSALVREHGYKVVLTGEGADEMLGGYDIFKEAKIRRFWAAQPDSRLRPLLLKRLYPYLDGFQAQSDAYRQAFFRVRPEDLRSPFFSHLPRWELTSRVKLFFSDDVRAALADHDPFATLRVRLPGGFERWETFAQAQCLETMGLLPGYILSSQGDRVAMAHAVEGRFPFLDYRVVEFAASLPARFKMKALDEKHLLKRAAGALIPPAVKARPKQPYRAPEAKSFFSSNGRAEYVSELLSANRVARDGVFNARAVERLVSKVRAGQTVSIRDNMALVGILSTELLLDQFVYRLDKAA